MALGTPVAGAAAYSASAGTTVAPAYPAGILSTDAVLLFVGQKPSTANGGTVTTPTGWTLHDELTAAGGYGTTLGADTGNTNLRVYSWNTPVNGQTGTLSVTLGGNGVSWAFMVRVPTGGGALSYGSADGQRTTTPTSPMSIALTNGASATAFQTGDQAIWAMCIPTDVTTPSQFSAQSITATGATFGTATELNEPDSTTGNDIGGYSAWANVTAGSSSTAPTVTSTLAGTLTNVRGPVVLLRIREAPVTHGTTGVLTGQGSEIVGSSDRQSAAVAHTSDGSLTGQIGSIVGDATRFRAHATSGVLDGQTATITGDADREAAAIPHTTAGDLTGQGSTLTGSATRFRAHATSGSPVGAGAVITGDADHEAQIIPHVSSGALTGQGSLLSGSAFVSHLHATSGALTGPGSEIVGDAELTPYAPTVHDTDGILIGSGSIIVGQAALVTSVIGGGGPGNAVTQPKKPKGWANERAQFEESQIERIAQTLTESEQPQVKKIARKLVDYTGEIEQIASLQREIEKLESAKVSRILDQERNQDIKAALAELNEILQDDEDAAEALMMLHEMETRQVLGILGILR